MNNIVILGAGFAGLRCAIQLERRIKKAGLADDWNVVLVDKNSYHTYMPALYEAASAYIWTGAGKGEKQHFEETLGGSLCLSINSIIRKKRIAFVHSGVESIDFENKIVKTGQSGEISYKYLVMALGSESMYFNIKGADACCFTLKSLHDALRIRRRIEEIFDAYKKSETDTKDKIVITVVGGGATGVEVAGEVAMYAKHLAGEMDISRSKIRLSLLEAEDEILYGYAKKQREAIARRLKKLGVLVRTGSKIKEVENTCVILERGERCPSSITIWAAGIRGPAIFKGRSILELGARGRVVVNKFLQLNSDKNIFGIGDNAVFLDKKTHQSAPPTAHIAQSQADIVAGNLIRLIEDSPLAAYKIDSPGYILSCGSKYAVANLWGMNISGFVGWMLKRLVDLRYFTSILPLKSALSVWFEELKIFTKND